MILIIEIDGYFHQLQLTGKKCSKQELIKIYLQAKELAFENRDLANVFCRLHNFVLLPYYNDVEVGRVCY